MRLTIDDFVPKPEKPPVCFAKIADIGEEGVQLLIDGEEIITSKYYKVMKPYIPTKGDRVLLNYVAGTILVMGAV